MPLANRMNAVKDRIAGFLRSGTLVPYDKSFLPTMEQIDQEIDCFRDAVTVQIKGGYLLLELPNNEYIRVGQISASPNWTVLSSIENTDSVWYAVVMNADGIMVTAPPSSNPHFRGAKILPHGMILIEEHKKNSILWNRPCQILDQTGNPIILDGTSLFDDYDSVTPFCVVLKHHDIHVAVNLCDSTPEVVPHPQGMEDTDLRFNPIAIGEDGYSHFLHVHGGPYPGTSFIYNLRRDMYMLGIEGEFSPPDGVEVDEILYFAIHSHQHHPCKAAGVWSVRRNSLARSDITDLRIAVDGMYSRPVAVTYQTGGKWFAARTTEAAIRGEAQSFVICGERRFAFEDALPVLVHDAYPIFFLKTDKEDPSWILHDGVRNVAMLADEKEPFFFDSFVGPHGNDQNHEDNSYSKFLVKKDGVTYLIEADRSRSGFRFSVSVHREKVCGLEAEEGSHYDGHGYDPFEHY